MIQMLVLQSVSSEEEDGFLMNEVNQCAAGIYLFTCAI